MVDQQFDQAFCAIRLYGIICRHWVGSSVDCLHQRLHFPVRFLFPRWWFCIDVSVSLAAIRASKLLYTNALTSLLRSPVSFFDTTPIGRIMSRMSRDVEALDNTLPNSFYQFLRMAAGVLGAIFLIFYTFPYLGIAIPVLFLFYYLTSTFYR